MIPRWVIELEIKSQSFQNPFFRNCQLISSQWPQFQDKSKVSTLNFPFSKVALLYSCFHPEEINCCKGDSNDNRCFVIPIPPRDRLVSTIINNIYIWTIIILIPLKYSQHLTLITLMVVKWAYLRSILIHHSIDGVIPYLGEEEEKAHFQVLLVGESHRHLHEPGQVNSSLPAQVFFCCSSHNL